MLYNKVNDNTNIYEINLKTFLEKQEYIAAGYLDALNKNTFMEIIDKYLMQTIEEVWEVVNSENDNEKIEELSDVLMYLGSTYALLACEIGNTHDNLNDMYVIVDKKEELDLNNITQSLISIRRLFPSRKWHKQEKENNKSIYIAVKLIENLMIDIIKYQISYKNSNKDIIDFDRYIENKEEMMLKKVDERWNTLFKVFNLDPKINL